MRGLVLMIAALAAAPALAGCDQVFGLDQRPWLDGFGFRKQIALTPAIAGDLVEFPVSIIHTDPNVADHALSDGSDLVFTTVDDEVLPYEIVDFDPMTGTVEAWVRVPVLAADQSTEVRLYYGGPPTASTEVAWPTSAEAVWHMSGTGGEQDSSVHGHGLTNSTQIDRVPGIAGAARRYAGASSLDAGDPADGSLDFGTSSFSVSLWVNVTTSNTALDMAMYKGGPTPGNQGYAIALGTGSWQLKISDGTNVQSVSFGDEADLKDDWTQLVAVIDREASEARVFANGTFVLREPLTMADGGMTTDPIGTLDNDMALAIGRPGYHGDLDEVRLHRRALTADSIAAEHQNLRTPATFRSISDEQRY